MLQQLLPVLLKKPQTGESTPLLSTLCAPTCNVAQPHTPLLVVHFCVYAIATLSKV